ncbi:MAG: hypothetical protein QMC78_05225 [Methanocellales archaeon]|nr:hypothetical protein [Methanocellales archaeon]
MIAAKNMGKNFLLLKERDEKGWDKEGTKIASAIWLETLRIEEAKELDTFVPLGDTKFFLDGFSSSFFKMTLSYGAN